MNETKLRLIRVLAILLVAVPLAGCMTPQQPSSPSDPVIADTVAPETVVPETATPDTVIATATVAVDLLPTPTTEPLPESVQNDTSTPAADAESSDAEWVQETFGEAWTIGYPAGWTVNAAGAHEGFLQVQGEYAGHSYQVTFSFPIGILVSSLDAWVDETLASLTPEQQSALVVSDLMVANTPAKKVVNLPSMDGVSTIHRAYIWRSEQKNPRLVEITQTDGQPLDAVAMEHLLDRFLATIQP